MTKQEVAREESIAQRKATPVMAEFDWRGGDGGLRGGLMEVWG